MKTMPSCSTRHSACFLMSSNISIYPSLYLYKVTSIYPYLYVYELTSMKTIPSGQPIYICVCVCVCVRAYVYRYTYI